MEKNSPKKNTQIVKKREVEEPRKSMEVTAKDGHYPKSFSDIALACVTMLPRRAGL